MLRPVWRWQLYLGLCCLFLWLPLTASAQAPLQAPRLRLAGPAGQTVIVVTRYYQAEQASKTVGSRFELGSAVQDIPLEEGSEGVRCFLIVPTNGQLVAALYDGQTLLSRATSAQPQVLQLLGGAVPEDSFRPPRALLDEREKRLAAQFFAALKPAASTRELVSNLPVANIDWQSLDAYSQTLQAELGTLRESALQLDGWLSWDGTLGARAISGLAEFEHGSCRFTLMEVDGKLVDVLVHSESMPPDWFHGPADSQAFQERSESLVRDLFSGQVAAAHSQFSPKYQAQVTRQTLAELSDGLNERFSAEVVGVELKKTWLGLYDSESRSKTFHVLHAISLADGKRLVSTVDFMFPCGPNELGRGHLAAVHFYESWRSSHPAMTQATLQTLRCLFSPATADRSEQQLASEFVSYHHPWVRNHLAAETLAELRRQVRGQWQALAGPVEWELWRVQELGKHLTASGPLPVQQGQLDVRAEFSEGQLLGLTLLGPSYATSTLDRFDGLQPLAESGRLFWNELLGGQIASAHARLAPAFRQQLPLQEFETLVAHSDIGQSPELSRIRWECTRLSTRLPRSEPIAFAAYYIAEFNDGSWRPLQCEFREREQQAGNFELLTFRDNVEAEFPVAGEATGEKILAAFLSGDPQQVIELTAEPERDRVQPQILQAFLNKLRKVAGSARLPERSRLMHVYAAGTRYERLSTALLLDDGQSLPFEADMQLGAIRSFYFTSPELEAFAEEVENVADLELLGNEFFRYWLTENDLPQASQRLVPALRDEQWQGRLQVIRQELLQDYGALQASRLSPGSAHAAAREIAATFELEFARGVVKYQLNFELDAVSASILSLQRQ